MKNNGIKKLLGMALAVLSLCLCAPGAAAEGESRGRLCLVVEGGGQLLVLGHGRHTRPGPDVFNEVRVALFGGWGLRQSNEYREGGAALTVCNGDVSSLPPVAS